MKNIGLIEFVIGLFLLYGVVVIGATLVLSGTVPDKGCMIVAGKYVQNPDSDLKCEPSGQTVKVIAP